MTLRSYAKINLGLYVTGKRPDGYHNLQTIFQTVDLADTLSLEEAPDVSVHSNVPSLDADPTNLCLRAANALRQLTGVTRGVRMTVQKNIPMGGGLGGGSSNAAAVLLGLNEFWNLRLTHDQLHAQAVLLGADVSFFLHGGTAFASGRGEILEQMQVNIPFSILLVSPPLHISTAWAYGALHLNNGGNTRDLKRAFEAFLRTGKPDGMENDLAHAVFAQHAELKTIKESLTRAGAALSMLSGSGSTVFGLFREESQARAAEKQFSPPIRTFLVKPILETH